MYMRAGPHNQSNILEFICQLLTLNVNYSMLDSNLEFFKFVQDQLDTIEGGRVADAEVLIVNLIRFLLSNKSLTTTPEVIRITDNLLANQNIRECSLRALIQLSHEIFFNQKAEGRNANSQLNTEKEFIFSILMKFLNEIQVQKCVHLILKTYGENQEYKKSVQEAIFSMIEKFQIGEAEIEMKLVRELLKSSSVEGEETVHFEAVKRIINRLTFDKKNPVKNWQILSVVSQEMIFKGTETDLDHLVVEKFIDLNKKLPQIVDRVADKNTLLEVYQTNRWTFESLSSNLKSTLKEESKESLSLDLIFPIRFNHPELFLLIIKDWIGMGVIENFHPVIGSLNCEKYADRVLVKEIFRFILTEGKNDPKVIKSYLPILKGKIDIFVEILCDLNQCVMADEMALEVVQCICKTTKVKSIEVTNFILKKLEEISSKDERVWDIEIMVILGEFLRGAVDGLAKRRAKDLGLALWTRCNDEEKKVIAERIPDLQERMG